MSAEDDARTAERAGAPRVRRHPDGTRHAVTPTGRDEDWHEWVTINVPWPGSAVWRHVAPDRDEGAPSVLDGWRELVLADGGPGAVLSAAAERLRSEGWVVSVDIRQAAYGASAARGPAPGPHGGAEGLRDRMIEASCGGGEELYEDHVKHIATVDAVLPVVQEHVAEQDKRATHELDSHLSVLREERDYLQRQLELAVGLTGQRDAAVARAEKAERNYDIACAAEQRASDRYRRERDAAREWADGMERLAVERDERLTRIWDVLDEPEEAEAPRKERDWPPPGTDPAALGPGEDAEFRRDAAPAPEQPHPVEQPPVHVEQLSGLLSLLGSIRRGGSGSDEGSERDG